MRGPATEREWLDERKKEAAAAFSDHRVWDARIAIAETSRGATADTGRVAYVEAFRFAKPRSDDLNRPATNYGLCFTLLDSGHLVVTGDLGDAIYFVGAPNERGIVWFARCDLQYFASKCVASEHGRGYESWDRELAEIRIRERYLNPRDEGFKRQLLTGGEFEHWDGAIGSRDEWFAFCQTAIGSDEVWADYEEAPFAIGEVVDGRCALHLAALKASEAALRAAAQQALDLSSKPTLLVGGAPR